MPSDIWTVWNCIKLPPRTRLSAATGATTRHLDAAAGVDGIEAFYDTCVTNGVNDPQAASGYRVGVRKTSTLRIPTATSSRSAAVQRKTRTRLKNGGAAPRAARRPSGKARRPSIPGVLVICFTQVTPTGCVGAVGDGRRVVPIFDTGRVRWRRLAGPVGKTICHGVGMFDG